jgi:hypothetical protein
MALLQSTREIAMKNRLAALGAAFLLLVIIFAVPVRKVAAVTYTKIRAAWIQASLIDSTPIGSNTPSTGAFTSASASIGFTGSLTGNASTATALAATPTSCGTNGIATGISANGNCVANSYWTPRTCNANGCYRIEPDGTYFETITGVSLANNSTTTITLPHSIPTAIETTVCNDGGSRVQSGNVPGVGSNVAGLVAPFTQFYANANATSVTASCIVIGY